MIGRGEKEGGRQVGKSNRRVNGRDISQPGQYLVDREGKEGSRQVGKLNRQVKGGDISQPVQQFDQLEKDKVHDQGSGDISQPA